MNPRTKIKVRRDVLVDALRERKREMDATFEAEMAAYEEQARTEARRHAAFLTDLAKKARVGAHVYVDGYGVRVNGEAVEAPERASKPHHARDYTGLTSAIAQLEMGADDTISISVEDFGRYLGGGR